MHLQAAKMVNVTFKTTNKGSIQHLTMDFVGLKIYVEEE
ncbi:hypothetical protein BTN50_0014 [Candidatus Enterovibrio altilux]|uniref:Mobile element protein n=1 Tax=Candidatus Enterovibrio altilux TaxID=1927128 RepID=A0A291B6D4_9GAMM|nr:hypothetical protein BTN50_0014 [Candidatus Enterovibrio luxaltus]